MTTADQAKNMSDVELQDALAAAFDLGRDGFYATKEIIDAATEGPWEDGGVLDMATEISTSCVVTDPVDPNDGEEVCLSGDMGDPPQESKNMEFIARARTGWPAALDALAQ